MNREQFADVMMYLAHGSNQNPSKELMEVYYDLLRDLPLDVLHEAARRALLHMRTPMFPAVGLIRQYAERIFQEQAEEIRRMAAKPLLEDSRTAEEKMFAKVEAFKKKEQEDEKTRKLFEVDRQKAFKMLREWRNN